MRLKELSKRLIVALLLGFCACEPAQNTNIPFNGAHFREVEAAKEKAKSTLENGTNTSSHIWRLFSDHFPQASTEIGVSFDRNRGLRRLIMTKEILLYGRYLVTLKVNVFPDTENEHIFTEAPILYIFEVKRVLTLTDGRKEVHFTENSAELTGTDIEKCISNGLHGYPLGFDLKTNAPVESADALLPLSAPTSNQSNQSPRL